jgi:hypothetical protein
LLDGCDFEHWLVVVEPPQNDTPRDAIIDSYIKTLAQVVGSEDEARMKIYSVSTKHYFAFGALVTEEVSYKIKEIPGVRWVLPDSYLDVKNKDYGGEPFINGEAAPYDPKYHEEWVRNSQRANERNKSGGRRGGGGGGGNRVYENRNTDRPRQPVSGPPPPGFNRPPQQQQGFNNGPPPQQGYNNGPPPQQGYNNGPPPQQGYSNGPPPQQGYSNRPPPQGSVVTATARMPPQQERMGDAMNPPRGNMGTDMPPPHVNFNGQQQQMPPPQQQWNGGQPNYSGGPPPNYGGNQPQNYGGQQGYGGPQNTGGQNFQQQRNPTPYGQQQSYPPPPPMGNNSGSVDGGIPYAQQNMPGRDFQ